MRRHLVVGLATVGLLTAACGSGSDHVSSSPAGDAKLLEARNVAMVRPGSGVDYTSMSAGIRALGYRLAGRLAGKADRGNLVCSPTSLAVAFAMLREGAQGKTAAAIDRALHLPADRHASYNALVTALQNPGAGNVLQMSNGLFLDPQFVVENSYLVALKKWYGTGVYQTSFPGQALDDINAYVDVNTHGRIPHLIDKLDPLDYFALINTVYLNAKWQHPFDKDLTEELPFTTASGHQVRVKMMAQRGQIDYASGPGWQAVRLPYQGDRLSMWVLLPKGTTQPIDLLAPQVLARAGAGFAPQDVDLSLPRWDLDNLLDLKATLLAMGLSDTFDGKGDFRGITPDPQFDVHRVLQQANIAVGEKGTIAAAATAIIARFESAPMPAPFRFDANHPFAYAIMDNTTGTPLFEGVVSDPS